MNSTTPFAKKHFFPSAMKNAKRSLLFSLGMAVAPAFLASSFLLAAPSSVQAEEESLTQNFQNVEIAKVIEAVAKISGKNFVIDPRVKGRVTLITNEGMDPKDLYETLLAVLDVHGYVAVPSENVIKIIPANMAKDKIPYRKWHETDEDWATEVINVEHVEATKLVAILRPMVAREGHLVALGESNKLILTDTIANIQRIKAVLKRVDVDVASGYEVIQVKHAPAADLSKTIKNLLPKKSASNALKLSVDERTNRIILMGEEQQRMQIRALIADLDIAVNANGMLEVIYLRYAKASEILPVLQKIAENTALLSTKTDSADGGDATLAQAPSAPEPEMTMGGDPVQKVDQPVQQPKTKNATPPARSELDQKTLKSQIRIEADERMNALVISAPTAVLKNLKEVIKQLDIRRAQVLIEAVFVEIAEDRSNNLGVEWSVLGSSGAGVISFSGALPSILATAQTSPEVAAGALSTGINIGGGDISSSGRGWAALLQALKTDSSSNILSSPSLLTLDNEEAEILVGREVPFQTGSYTTSTSNSLTNPFSTIERENVGLKLKVKPQINEGDEIYLDIDQEVSDILPKGEAVDIQTTQRQIKTRVIVGDGDVVVLGGLISQKETDVDSKVPGLGDIPGVGAIFSSTENKREKINLMVFLRPVIVRDNKMSNFYSQRKYSYIYDEQQKLLAQPLKEWQDPGLRPKLPTFEEYQKGQTMPSEKPADSKTSAKDSQGVQVEVPDDANAMLEAFE